MKKHLRFALRATMVILVGLIALFLLISSITVSQDQRQMSLALSDALSDARSVSLTEFSRRYYKLDEKEEHQPEIIQHEVILNRVVANAIQINELRAATSSYLVLNDGTISIRGCYDPHHRIEIVKQDGSRASFEICFGCQRFSFGQWRMENLPKSWIAPLRAVFARAGLPTKAEGEYLMLASEKMKS